MDAYVEILKHMQNQGAKFNPPAMQLGEMVNSTTLKIGDLQVDKDNLLIADYLLNTYKRKIKIPTTTATGIVGEHSISSIGIPDAQMNFTDTLKAGDVVLVTPISDMQLYIILAKVVKL